MEKTILITGSSRGIGAATAVLAAQQGYRVCVNYRRDREAAQRVAETIEKAGGEVEVFGADVAQEAEVAALFEAVDKRFGALHVLVNNAGMLEPQMRVETMEADRWRRVLEANLISQFLCIREALRRMSTKHGGTGGAIVNISSVAARLGAPGEYVDYAAAKAGVDALTIGLAKEVAEEGIRVNGVRPGPIYTDIHADGGEPGRVDRVKEAVPQKRGGYPDEVARAILWLASDEASYCTGSFIDVSGGR